MSFDMKKFLVVASLLLAAPAFAQSVQQSGTVTAKHVAAWVTSGVIGDGGSSASSPLTSIGVTNNGGAGICVNSALPTSPGYQALCLGASTAGPGVISLQNYGTATAQSLEFVVNGTPVIIPTGGANFLLLSGAAINGHVPCFSGTIGVVVDCGTSLGAGTQFGLPYYSTTSSLGSTGAGTAGQFLLGQGASVPLWASLSGDVTSVSAGGALTLGKVNGIPFASSYGANGVLIGEGTNAFHSISTLNIGQCLLSQGASDPIWSSCASGSGSAGGSNTQVQFNNATALGGSPNFTWVSPALTLGLAGSVTGQLALAPAVSGSGTVTVQNPSTTSAYNFNLPPAAGSSGQPLLSGGGGATAMSFGTLGIAGGGTNCSSASGTCLDNITGFASTGFVQRTGSGSYAFSLVVPVSGGGTGLANGTSGGILGFTGASTITSSALLGANGVMIGGGAGATPTAIAACTNGQLVVGATSAPPACQTMGGDISAITSAGVMTIANSAITVAKQANAAAFSLEGNFTGSSAAPQFSTIGALTQKASPAASDLILLQDQAAAGALKFATVSSVSSAGSVGSIAGNTGAFTLNGTSGITNSTNDILCSAGSSSQFGCVKVDNVTLLASAGIIGLKNSSLTNSLGSNVAMNNTALFFTGPSVVQGTTGVWLASGTVTLVDTASVAGFNCVISDGSTNVASARGVSQSANSPIAIALSGVITNPAGNLRISCQDTTSVNGSMQFNASGLSKDSTLTVYRIQ